MIVMKILVHDIDSVISIYALQFVPHQVANLGKKGLWFLCQVWKSGKNYGVLCTHEDEVPLVTSDSDPSKNSGTLWFG